VTGAIAVGGFSGGAFNPAVVTGLNIGTTLIDGYDFNFLDWIVPVVFEFVGGVMAGIIFMITESIEEQEGTKAQVPKCYVRAPVKEVDTLPE